MAELTAKQRRFADEYIACGEATKSAIAAGYSEKTAAQQGYQLLQHPSVAAYVAEGQKAAAERAGVTADRVRAELAAIAFSDIRNFADWRDVVFNEQGDKATLLKLRAADEITDAAARAISEVRMDAQGRLSIRQHDKLRALEILGRDFGIGKETLKVDLGLGDLFDQVRRAAREVDGE